MPRQLRRAASPVPFVDVKSLWRNGVFCPIILFVCCAPHHVVAQLTPTLIGDNTSPTDHTDICFVACEETPDTDIAVPGTGCQQFYVCRGGKITNRLACSDGRAFNNEIGFCDHESVVECVDPTCSPTDNPTTSPTASPSDSPTTSPTESPTDSPSESPTQAPSPSPKYAIRFIESKESLIEELVMKSYNADGLAFPSIRYSFDGFFRSLQLMAYQDFSGIKFMLWDTQKGKYKLGLVNVAAFLSNVMVEAIYDDICDELNWQHVAGRHAISNACGQEGRSYQDETCGIYSCEVDPNMEITAVTAANEIRAPPPLECRPGSGPGFYAGYWDTNIGVEVNDNPYANTAGRIDVEGCCYWGRGALLTRGSCNIGKLNYYLGARAAREGRKSMYPTIDFCLDPEVTCASEITEELRWTTAFFEWSERVQRYNNNGWAYEDELIKFFDGGMVDDSFIESVSRIFARGCHVAGCSDLEVRMMDERKANFNMIVNDLFDIVSIDLETPTPTSRPTSLLTPSPPTMKPTQQTPKPTQQQPYTTPPYPPSTIIATPRPTPNPNGFVPNLQPSSDDSNEQRDVTYEPTYETIIGLEDNGGGMRPDLLKCICVLLCICIAQHLAYR